MHVKCECGTEFVNEDEFTTWEMYRRHVESRAALDELGTHSVVASGKPLTYVYRPPDDLRELVRWMAQTVHQAYHQDAEGGVDTCSMSICMAATRALEEDPDDPVSVPGVFPAVHRAPGVGPTDP